MSVTLYKLAKELEKNGFPKVIDGHYVDETGQLLHVQSSTQYDSVYLPTLDELFKEVVRFGKGFSIQFSTVSRTWYASTFAGEERASASEAKEASMQIWLQCDANA